MLPPVPTEEEVTEAIAHISHLQNGDIRKFPVRVLYNKNLYDWNQQQ